MKNSAFDDLLDFDVPKKLIARYPSQKRDESRLLHVQQHQETFQHCQFHQLLSILKPGDLLILNNSRVLQARLYVFRASGAKIEICLLKHLEAHRWEALVKSQKKVRLNEALFFDLKEQNQALRLTKKGQYICEVEFDANSPPFEMMEKWGEMPLPPYLDHNSDEARSLKARYQTVYAQHDGAVAAPTAGLHFTPELMARLREKGVQFAYVTLHVGYGTFQPLNDQQLKNNQLHEEKFFIEPEYASLIESHPGRRIAVGTTAIRALESAAYYEGGHLKLTRGWQETSLLIKPGFSFKTCHALITNFHLPKTSLLLLVAAFIGEEKIKAVYQDAILNGYRFYSFGDAMLLDKDEI